MSNNKQKTATAKEVLKPSITEVNATPKSVEPAVKQEAKPKKKHYRKPKKAQSIIPAAPAKKLTLWQRFLKWCNEPITFKRKKK
jgi:hypothetical protein